jgi:predicted Fe-Mo cluster-binding NifX family protein
MKIAVPTNDGVTMSHHFGRSEAFLVFDIMDNSIKNRETRSNAGRCSHGPQQAHGEECQSGAHSHAGVGSVLTDCELVICTGIGDGAAQALQARGIKVMLTGSGAGPAEEAVRAYLAGTLVETFASSCGCHR